MPISVGSVNKQDCSTVKMMRLFQDNVKKDISNTNDVINEVQKRLKACDLSLSSLKKFTSELNSDFAHMKNKVNNLGESIKELTNSSNCTTTTTNPATWLSSSPSRCSFSSDSSETSQSSLHLVADEVEELERTYLFVEHSIGDPNGAKIEEYSELKKAQFLRSASVSNSEESCSDLEDCSDYDDDNDDYLNDCFDDDERDELDRYRIQLRAFSSRENKLINQNCDRIIKKLLENSSSLSTSDLIQRF